MKEKPQKVKNNRAIHNSVMVHPQLSQFLIKKSKNALKPLSIKEFISFIKNLMHHW